MPRPWTRHPGRPSALAVPLAVLALLGACAANGPETASGAAGAAEPAAPAVAVAASAAPEGDAMDDAPTAGDEIHDVPGHVVHIRGDWYALDPEGQPGSRYAPDDLPEEFRQDGLAVVFSGRIGEIPPNVRMWGTPLELTAIRRRDESGR